MKSKHMFPPAQWNSNHGVTWAACHQVMNSWLTHLYEVMITKQRQKQNELYLKFELFKAHVFVQSTVLCRQWSRCDLINYTNEVLNARLGSRGLVGLHVSDFPYKSRWRDTTSTSPKWVSDLQPADIGWPTGNGKKLSCSQAHLGQATGLAVALNVFPFPVGHPMSAGCIRVKITLCSGREFWISTTYWSSLTSDTLRRARVPSSNGFRVLVFQLFEAERPPQGGARVRPLVHDSPGAGGHDTSDHNRRSRHRHCCRNFAEEDDLRGWVIVRRISPSPLFFKIQCCLKKLTSWRISGSKVRELSVVLGARFDTIYIA